MPNRPQLPATTTPGPGGQGGGLGYFRKPAEEWSRADIRDVGRAATGRWPLADEERRPIIETLITIATNPGMCGIRESIAAATVLIAADKINIEEEARSVKGPEIIELEPGRARPSFESMSDEELERFINA